MNLKPFNSNGTCTKCGFTSPIRKYCESCSKAAKEHLHIECLSCGYKEYTQVKDSDPWNWLKDLNKKDNRVNIFGEGDD